MKQKTYNSLKQKKSFFVQKNQPHGKMIDRMEKYLILVERLFDSMIDGILITDKDGDITFINPAFSKISGYGEEVIGLNPRILKSGQHSASFFREMWQSIEHEGHWKGEIWNKRKNGELYIQRTTITRITDDLGKPLYYASVITDITQRVRVEKQMKDDLLLAREVQKGALSKPIKNKHIHIEGVYLPSEMLGGDMYAWYQIDAHRYGMFLMDVMGHGVAPALVCMSVLSLLRGIITKCIDPDKVMQELNRHVFSLFRDEDSLPMKHYYLTSIYAVIDTQDKRITYASAGHPPGLLFDGNGQVIELDIGTVPLGMMSEMDVPIGVHSYSPNTKIVFYTDGIMEDENKNIRENIEQLKILLNENQHLEADQMLNETISTLLNKAHSSRFQDDVTLIAATLR